MKLYQVYALVTKDGWSRSLSKRWPDAPLVGNYRLLVFTNEDLPKLKEEYTQAVFKELDQQQTINAMSAGEVGPFLCSLNTVTAIIDYFNPPKDEV